MVEIPEFLKAPLWLLAGLIVIVASIALHVVESNVSGTCWLLILCVAVFVLWAPVWL